MASKEPELVRWVEWLGIDGIIHAITEVDFEEQKRILQWACEIQPVGLLKKYWLPVGRHPKCWELKQYDANPIPAPRTTEEAVEEDTAKEVA